MKALAVAAAVAALGLAGCAANQPAMDRDEFIATTQHQYEDVTEKQFYAAAKRLFELSDEDDTSFSYPSEHSMIARRSWTIYMVLAFSAGTHVWQIDTEPSGSGVTARALVSNNSGTVTGMATGGGGAFASSGPQMENVINTPAIYGLFWSRMDFLLGKSSYWPTCDDWGSKISQGDTYGNTEPLCLALNTDDLKPPEASSN